MATDLLPVEVLTPGHYRRLDGQLFEITPAHLDEVVANFAKLKAHVKPAVKLGHGEQQYLKQAAGQPALGWIADLRRVGNTVVASLSDVPAALQDLIRKRRYRRVSPEMTLAFEHSDYERNLKTGVTGLVMDGLALLGADSPQIPNLQDLDALATFLGSTRDELRLAASTPPADPATRVQGDEVPAPISPAAPSHVQDASVSEPVKEPIMADPKTDEVAALSQRLAALEAEKQERDAQAATIEAANATLAKTVDAQAAELAQLRKDRDEAAARERVALARQRDIEAEQFADRYCQATNLRILPTQKPYLAALHRALSEAGTAVTLSAEAATQMQCAKASNTAYTGVELLTALLEAGPDHKALLTAVPRKPAVTGAAALDGDNYEAAIAYVAETEKLSLAVPEQRAKAALKLIELRPQFRNARVAS